MFEGELDPPEKAVLEKWGSEEILYEFLNKELKRINIIAFNDTLSLPRIQVKPEFLSRGIMGEYFGGKAGGDYYPSEKGRSAKIGIFSSILTDKELTKVVLAHELTHHWDYEAKEKEKSNIKPYPKSIDRFLEKRFKNPLKLNSWRSMHNQTFISKAIEVADILGIDRYRFLCR